MDLIPGLGRSPEGGNCNPLQYSCMGKFPWMEGLDGLQSLGLQRVRSFSCIYWPFICLIDTISLPIFCCWIVLLWFFFWVVNVSCIYWIITIYWICGLQMFVSINFSFLFFWWLLYCGEVFSFDVVTLVCFCLCSF